MQKKKKKDIEVKRVKNLTTTWVMDALIGDEEQAGKMKRKQRMGTQPCYPGPFGRLLRPTWIIQ